MYACITSFFFYSTVFAATYDQNIYTNKKYGLLPAQLCLIMYIKNITIDEDPSEQKHVFTVRKGYVNLNWR